MFLSPLRSNDRFAYGARRCCLCCSYKLAFLLFSLPRQEVLISLAVERSALPYDSSVRGPRKSLIFGESGGIERFQLAKRVLCASIAERDCKGTKKIAHMQKNILEWFRYLLTLCFVFLAADGVGPRNVVSVVVNIIILVV